MSQELFTTHIHVLMHLKLPLAFASAACFPSQKSATTKNAKKGNSRAQKESPSRIAIITLPQLTFPGCLPEWMHKLSALDFRTGKERNKRKLFFHSTSFCTTRIFSGYLLYFVACDIKAWQSGTYQKALWRLPWGKHRRHANSTNFNQFSPMTRQPRHLLARRKLN